METNDKIELIEETLLDNVSGGREQEFCMNCLSCIQCIFQPD